MKKILLTLMTLISLLGAGLGAGTLIANAEETCAQGHDYLITAETLPTCTAAGSRTKTCSRCNDTITETLAQLNHNYVLSGDPEFLYSPATCTDNSKYYYHCKLCLKLGDQVGQWNSDAKGHLYEVISETEPSCKPGTRISRCARCANRKTESIPAISEHAWERQDVLAATCTETGLWQYVCNNCGETKTGDDGGVIAALGHNLTTQTTEATCTTRKTVTSSCSRCDYSVSTESGNFVSHILERRVTLAATCTTGGTFETVCKNCGVKIGEGTSEALGHDYHITSETLPTCTVAGSSTKRCSRCGDETTDVLPHLNHGLKYDTNPKYLKTPATCTLPAWYYASCPYCLEPQKETFMSGNPLGLGHVYEIISETEPSCEPGTRISRCTRCANRKTEEIPATSEHVWERQDVLAATCTETGLWQYTCPNCGETKSGDDGGVIAALGHDLTTQTTEATCTTRKTVTSSCSRCDYSLSIESGNFASHSAERRVTLAATCTTGGTFETVCKNCGVKIGEGTSEALGHDYDVTSETAATCTAVGSRTSTCSRCNDVTVEEIPATGHNYENGSCTICGAENETPKPVPVVSNSAFDFLKDPDVWILIGGIAAGVVLIGVAGRRRR